MRKVRAQRKNLPLLPSRKIVKALERLGCYEVKTTGSHASYARDLPDGSCLTAIVIVGKSEVTRGTLQKILDGLKLDLAEFLKHVK